MSACHAGKQAKAGGAGLVGSTGCVTLGMSAAGQDRAASFIKLPTHSKRMSSASCMRAKDAYKHASQHVCPPPRSYKLTMHALPAAHKQPVPASAADMLLLLPLPHPSMLQSHRQLTPGRHHEGQHRAQAAGNNNSDNCKGSVASASVQPDRNPRVYQDVSKPLIHCLLP